MHQNIFGCKWSLIMSEGGDKGRNSSWQMCLTWNLSNATHWASKLQNMCDFSSKTHLFNVTLTLFGVESNKKVDRERMFISVR